MILNRATMVFLFSMLLTLTACVTINVYFPAAQAEAAAERIVDDILGVDGASICLHCFHPLRAVVIHIGLYPPHPAVLQDLQWERYASRV